LSAIFGVIRQANPSGLEADIASMGNAFSEWPADAFGIWTSAGVAVGCQQRYNTPESRFEKQPTICGDTGRVLVCHARIDNRETLLDRLGLARAAARWSDSELILSAFERWGSEAPTNLRGDYVLALWDPRTEELTLARDPLGIRQLYWYSSEGTLAFASRVDSLLALDSAPRRLSELWVAGMLQWGLLFDEPTLTPVEGIQRLCQGTVLRLRRGKSPVTSAFWRPNLTFRSQSDEDTEEQFRELFHRAVRSRMRSAYPVASTLSGGLDSSAVTRVAALQAAPDQLPIRTISATFPSQAERAPSSDESSYVRDVNDFEGRLEPLEVRADELTPFSFEEELGRALEAPSFSPNGYINWAVYRATREAGCRTLLTGVDGDTVISHGLEALPYYFRRLRWLRLLKEIRHLQRMHPMFRAPTRRILWRGVLRVQLAAWLPTPLLRWRAIRYQRISWFPAMVLRRDFAERVKLVERRAESRLPKDRGETNCFGFSPMVFATQIHDSLASQNGIEARHPFMDQDLVEFCLRLPHDQRLRSGWTRSILRRALSEDLPQSVRERLDKGTQGTNGQLKLGTTDSDRLKEGLLSGASAIQQFIDQDAVNGCLDQFLAAPMARFNEAGYAAVYSVWALGNWLRRNPLGLTW
jgi:asparagine synthase (glutamine-hydrolysing)